MRVIEHLPFQAIRGFFEEAAVLDPQTLPQDREALLELAYDHQNALRAFEHPNPPLHRLRAVGLGSHCLPLFRVSHGTRKTLTLLYSLMLYRVALNTLRDPRFPHLGPRTHLRSLRTHLDQIARLVQPDLSDVAKYVPLTHSMADYLNHLAFLVWKAENPPLEPPLGEASDLLLPA